MRLPLIAAFAALGLAACGEQDTTVDEQIPATADYPTGAAVSTNADASADATASAAAADAANVTAENQPSP